MQQYDPYVYEALKHFDGEYDTKLLKATKGSTRVAGDDVSLMDRLSGYDKPVFTLKRKYQTSYNIALRELERRLRLNEKVNPRWIYDVDIINSTTTGYPHFKKKGDIREKIFGEARFLFHLMKRKEFSDMGFPFTVPATRGASRPQDKEKTRLVWVYPAAVLIAEGVYAQPLIDKLYSGEFSELFLTGTNALGKHRELIAQLSNEEERIGVGGDFESYDTMACNFAIKDVFALLSRKLNHGTYEGKTKEDVQTGGLGVKRRSEHAFSNIVEYFINTPMILPNGRIVRKQIGVPSGSHFTNLIDSLVNWLMHKTFSLYHRIKVEHLKVNGDDSAFICGAEHKKYILESMRTFFLDAFGLTLNKSKSIIAERPSEMHMSGTTWSNFVPTRTTEEWFKLALNPKTYVKDPGEGFQRLLGIGYCGGFTDATYCKFFNYYQRGYNCNHLGDKLNWEKYRWMEFLFGTTELPVYYKSRKSMMRLQARLAI